MIKAVIRLLGLKGSWKWAKKQMLNGSVVRCKHWSGTLIQKIDSRENGLLQMGYYKRDETNRELEWETSNHFMSYEDFTDYEVWNN